MKQKKCLNKAWILCLFLFTAGVYAQENSSIEDLEAEKYRLERDVNRLSKKIETTEAIREQEKKRYNTLVERYQKAFLDKEKELRDLSQQLRSLDKDVREEVAKQNGIRIEGESLQSDRISWREILLEKGEELEKQVKQSLPWEREERLERVRALRRDISNQSASVEETFTRLMALYRDEIQFGDEIVIHAQPVQRLDGSLVNATLLRLGNQSMMYVDDEEKKYGILQRNEQRGLYEWKEDLSFAERDQVRKAIAVKLSKKAPQVVTLPLSLTFSTIN